MVVVPVNRKIVLGDKLPTGRFWLHSRFREVVNFQNAGKEITFITSNPDHIAANGIYVKNAALSAFDSLHISEDSMVAGKEKIVRSSAAVYNSRLSYHETDAAVLKELIMEIPGKHAALFPPGSMLFVLLPGKAPDFTGGFDILFSNKAREAAECLILGKFAEGVGLLKSSGRGLSPAGDDFIAGLLLGVHFNASLSGKNLSGLVNSMYGEALGSNLLVNAFLFHAKEGNYFGLFKNFVFSLPQTKKTLNGLIKLLSVGATSGADLLSGYIFSVKHNLGI